MLFDSTTILMPIIKWIKATLLGEHIKDARSYGWNFPEEKVRHNWSEMVSAIQDHIGSLNWGYRVQLRDKKESMII
jgi:hypothetical protein